VNTPSKPTNEYGPSKIVPPPSEGSLPSLRPPRGVSVESAFRFLGNAYLGTYGRPANDESTLQKQIAEALEFLHDQGWWFTWTGLDDALQCRTCCQQYTRVGDAMRHRHAA
jgi:hypothetical protein